MIIKEIIYVRFSFFPEWVASLEATRCGLVEGWPRLRVVPAVAGTADATDHLAAPETLVLQGLTRVAVAITGIVGPQFLRRVGADPASGKALRGQEGIVLLRNGPQPLRVGLRLFPRFALTLVLS